MQVHIQKWGNSLGLRIPMHIAKQLRLHQGGAVTLEIKNDQLIIRPPKYDLDSMLNQITAENQHHAVLDDTKRGKEEW